MTKGLDGCLFVYSQEEWKRIEESLREKPLTSKDARKFMRFFLQELQTAKWTSRKNPVAGTLARIRRTGKRCGVSRSRQPRGDLEQDKWETMNSDADMDEITGAMEGLGLTI